MSALAKLQFFGFRTTKIFTQVSPEFCADDTTKYTISFNKRIVLDGEQKLKGAELSILVYSPDDGNVKDAPFQCSITLFGKFALETQWDEKWEPNVLAILFPYLRAALTTVTSQIGISPIILPAYNIHELFKEKK